MEIRIEGDAELLKGLREEFFRELGDNAEVRDVTSVQPGELREVLLVSLVVALGGPVVVKGIVEIVKAYLAHRESMRKLDYDQQVRLILLKDDGTVEPVSL